MNISESIRSFVRKEIVLVISVAAALISCIFVVPDAAYFSYIDWHTLALLLSLMVVVAGLRFLGVIRIMGEWVVSHMRSKMMIASSLIGLTFACSMFITNDVALITFVPFAIVVMHRAKMDVFMGPVVALMTIAANLGSMMLPMGNPQNLYLFQTSQMNVVDFVALMAPYTGFAALLLAGFLFVLFRKSSKKTMEPPGHTEKIKRRYSLGKCLRAGVYGLLFLVCLCAVAGVIEVFFTCAVVVIVALFMDRKVFKRVDYGLLCTFIALFVFVGNMGRIPLIHEVVSQLVDTAPVIASVVLSQVISNVPAALLLSGFSDQWGALIIGTNLGGLGTLIASMASIISFKLVTAEGLVKRSAYLKTFTWYNVIFLAALLVFYGVFACVVSLS